MATDREATSKRLRTIALVAGVAFCSAVIITGAYEISHERILENQRARLLASLNSVIDDRYASEVTAIELQVPDGDEGDQIERIFAMQRDATLIAWVYAFVAPQGYNGPIEMLAGIRPDGTITRARVLQHRETPGLGDGIEAEKSDWIHQFDGKSLSEPSVWALKVDNGTFDAMTGATVTPRAVVAGIESVLRYHSAHEPELVAELERAETSPP
ncbi:MAG: RnfABCDGE type electron transport complex subunit G [Gammaproteobacteria bacterium]|jgi:electron transport complex protein RnfG